MRTGTLLGLVATACAATSCKSGWPGSEYGGEPPKTEAARLLVHMTSSQSRREYTRALADFRDLGSMYEEETLADSARYAATAGDGDTGRAMSFFLAIRELDVPLDRADDVLPGLIAEADGKERELLQIFLEVVRENQVSPAAE